MPAALLYHSQCFWKSRLSVLFLCFGIPSSIQPAKKVIPITLIPSTNNSWFPKRGQAHFLRGVRPMLHANGNATILTWIYCLICLNHHLAKRILKNKCSHLNLWYYLWWEHCYNLVEQNQLKIFLYRPPVAVSEPDLYPLLSKSHCIVHTRILPGLNF